MTREIYNKTITAYVPPMTWALKIWKVRSTVYRQGGGRVKPLHLVAFADSSTPTSHPHSRGRAMDGKEKRTLRWDHVLIRHARNHSSDTTPNAGLLYGCSCRPSHLTSGAIENEAAQAFHGLRPVGIGR